MSNEIFDVDNQVKREVQLSVRENFYGPLIDRGYVIDGNLLILHRLATYNLDRGEPLPEYTRNQMVLGLSRFMQKINGSKRSDMVKRIASGKHGEISIELPTFHGRGRYRLLGTIKQKGKIIENVWEPLGIKMTTRTGSIEVYETPSYDIDVLMDMLSMKYIDLLNDTSIGQMNDPVHMAICQTFFYTIGCLIIHPFLGGNHRAFDRNMELEFAKIGLCLNPKLDGTFNIPPSSEFRRFITMLLTNLLRREGLILSPDISTAQKIDVYQNKLDKAIKKLIAIGFSDIGYNYCYISAAKTLLDWVDFTDDKELGKISHETMNLILTELNKVVQVSRSEQ